jgi:hypothetical protein
MVQGGKKNKAWNHEIDIYHAFKKYNYYSFLEEVQEHDL